MKKDVHEANELKTLEEAKRQARLAHSAHEYFTGTTRGKELFEELGRQAGANCSAFKPTENFNSHGAAYRDGMRATFLIIQNLINQHKENHEPRTENQN